MFLILLISLKITLVKVILYLKAIALILYLAQKNIAIFPKIIYVQTIKHLIIIYAIIKTRLNILVFSFHVIII